MDAVDALSVLFQMPTKCFRVPRASRLHQNDAQEELPLGVGSLCRGLGVGHEPGGTAERLGGARRTFRGGGRVEGDGDAKARSRLCGSCWTWARRRACATPRGTPLPAARAVSLSPSAPSSALPLLVPFRAGAVAGQLASVHAKQTLVLQIIIFLLRSTLSPKHIDSRKRAQLDCDASLCANALQAPRASFPS